MIRIDKTAILIDAGYLSLISKHFGKGKHLKLDIVNFSRALAIKKDLWMEELYYYTAPPFQSTTTTNEENKLKKGYDKFISNMSQNKFVTIREGRVQKVKNKFTQKGVDTLVVMDLVRLGSSKKYKKILLLACDTDFVPIIKEVEEKGVEIILYYYTDRIRKSKFSMSNEILDVCKNKVLLKKEDFTENLYK